MIQQTQKAEPIGIVITRGAAPVAPSPQLSYVWGPAPELDLEADRATTKAA